MRCEWLPDVAFPKLSKAIVFRSKIEIASKESRCPFRDSSGTVKTPKNLRQHRTITG